MNKKVGVEVNQSQTPTRRHFFEAQCIDLQYFNLKIGLQNQLKIGADRVPKAI